MGWVAATSCSPGHAPRRQVSRTGIQDSLQEPICCMIVHSFSTMRDLASHGSSVLPKGGLVSPSSSPSHVGSTWIRGTSTSVFDSRCFQAFFEEVDEEEGLKQARRLKQFPASIELALRPHHRMAGHQTT